ncbi:MAG: efflux RND transporter periplasmic adaptor subunit, partial [Gammaproteobacteria bacterium]|nr:efflux RND transporter periplasmic adaptor subunit [Gammaproteobacteria bacterium]
MKFLSMNIRKLVFIGVLVSLFILFSYVVLKSGPLAPVLVTSATVKSRSITPALFGIGTVEARYTHKIGPTIAGRIKQVYVHAGDNVHAGQLLGEMDFVDLNERISAQKSLIKKGAAAFLVAKAQVLHASASNTYAKKQANRYEQLWEKRTVSKDQLEVKQQERQTAKAVLDAAYANLDVLRHDLAKLRANLRGLILHQSNLRLVSPINGLVVARDADPGTTMIAGQSVVNIVDPKNLWINVRFNQTSSYGI